MGRDGHGGEVVVDNQAGSFNLKTPLDQRLPNAIEQNLDRPEEQEE